jgi:hypothetical protein
LDKNKETKCWQHPAENVIRATDSNEEDSPLQIYTDGSKTEKRVGSGVAIYSYGQNIRTLQFKLKINVQTIKRNNYRY